MVTVRSRMFASDEELAKRDDDHKPKQTKLGPWNIRSRPWRKRRIAGYVLACCLLALFIYNIPTDLGPKDQRRPKYGRPSRAIPKSEYSSEQPSYDRSAPYEAPPESVVEARSDVNPTGPVGHDYDGPVRFYALAGSLHGIANIVDFRQGNRHVLFAASDLNSAAAIIPVACEMASWKRNSVHFAIMGRDEMPVEQIMDINDALYQNCPIYWHDGRPDSASISTDARMQLSVAGALGHMNSFMQPQALITADSDHENVYFFLGVSRAVRAIGLTHIEIPKEKPEKVAWLSRLDAGSLHAWHSANMDILVQAPLESSGSLIRLLTSLEHADYTGFLPPRLTIELPHQVDVATQNFLTRFKWPPSSYMGGLGQGDQLLIRRRISEQHVSVEEASRRFIESFYPSSPRGPHVLLLSPQVELSPAFYHYLKLHILEYKHAYDRPNSYRNMLGISLETPSTHLNASAEFVTPHSNNFADASEDENLHFEPFRWQAPNSNAALYFSDKWIELHSFLTKRRTATLHPRTRAHHASSTKHVSKNQPAWMEYMLDLMQVRGYWLHYPGLFNHGPRRTAQSSPRSSSSTSEEALVIVHNELYHPPEEFLHPHVSRDATSSTAPRLPSATVLTTSNDYLSSHHPVDAPSNYLNDERPLIRELLPLLEPLVIEQIGDPADMDSTREPVYPALPQLSTIPLLDASGADLDNEAMQKKSRMLRTEYRRNAGGCTQEQSEIDGMEPGSAEDLFCLDDEDVEQLVDNEEEEDDNDDGDDGDDGDDDGDVEENSSDEGGSKPTFSAPNAKSGPDSTREEARAAGAQPPASQPKAKPAVPLSPPIPDRVHGSDGAAAVINRVIDAERYEETARAGFLKKLADKEKNYEYLPAINGKAMALTEEEKQWLADQKKGASEELGKGEAAQASHDETDPAEQQDARADPPEQEPPTNDPDNLKATPELKLISNANENNDEFLRLIGSAREQAHIRNPQSPPPPLQKPPPKKQTKKINLSPLDTAAAAGADPKPGTGLPRDAPPLPQQPLAPGQTFEEQMETRDAAKKDALSERDRARKAGPGAGAGNLGKIRVAGDGDPEIVGNGGRRRRAGKGAMRAGDESVDELTGMPVAGKGTVKEGDVGAFEEAREAEKGAGQVREGKVAGKGRMRVLQDEDEGGRRFEVPGRAVGEEEMPLPPAVARVAVEGEGDDTGKGHGDLEWEEGFTEEALDPEEWEDEGGGDAPDTAAAAGGGGTGGGGGGVVEEAQRVVQAGASKVKEKVKAQLDSGL